MRIDFQRASAESRVTQATQLLLNPTKMVSDSAYSKKRKGKERGKQLEFK
jgi:hypothetical protein